MPDFSRHRRKPMRMQVPAKGAMRDLLETQRDINRAKKGESTEASLEEMRVTKQRLKKDIRQAAKEEADAFRRDAIYDMAPQNLPPPMQRPSTHRA